MDVVLEDLTQLLVYIDLQNTEKPTHVSQHKSNAAVLYHGPRIWQVIESPFTSLDAQ